MARKFLLVYAFSFAFAVLVSGFAFAEKSAVPKSELLKPIDLATEDYVSQYLLKPPTGYIPSVLAPTADAAIGTTWYDQQHHSSMPKMIANDYQGGGKGQHFCWMCWPYEPPVNRYVDYRYNNTGGSWQNKVVVDGGAYMAGYCGLDIFLNSYEALIFHTTARQYPDPAGTVRRAKIALEKGLNPGAGTFWVYDIPESTETMAEAGMWPRSAIDTCGNIHVLTLGAGVDKMPILAYIRCTPDGVLLRCEGPGDGPYYITKDERFMPDSNMISYLDHAGSVSYIVVTDPNSKKVALVWIKWTENWPEPDDTSLLHLAQDVWYLESDSCGNDWIVADSFGDFTFTNITQWAPDDPYRTYSDIAGVYDLGHKLHIFWNAHYLKEATDEYDPYDVALMHWSEDIEQACPNDDTVRYSVVSAVQNEIGEVVPWAWNRTLGKMSAGVGIAGSCKQGWLFLVWQQFNKGDLSAADNSNGEIYFSYSTNLGLSWAASRNLTNTPDSGCTAGNCDSEGWPSLANRVDSSMHIQYIMDRDAGSVIQDEGSYTENYVLYKRYRVDTLTAIAAPRVDWSPKGDLVYPWLAVPNGGEKTCTLTIRNIGTAALSGNLSTGASWITGITPPSFSLPEGPCPTFIAVDIDVGGYSDTFLVDTISVTTNDINFDVAVYVIVSDEYVAPEWKIVDNGTFQLYESNVGNIGPMFIEADSLAPISYGSVIFAAQFGSALYSEFDTDWDWIKVARGGWKVLKAAKWTRRILVCAGTGIVGGLALTAVEELAEYAIGKLVKKSKKMKKKSGTMTETVVEITDQGGTKTIKIKTKKSPVDRADPTSKSWKTTQEQTTKVSYSNGKENVTIEKHEKTTSQGQKVNLQWLPDEGLANTSNPDMYVGMIIDFDLPSDTGFLWNIPGYDESLNLLYVQGYGDRVTPTGAPYDSLYVGIACLGDDSPYSAHIIPNDVYLYPEGDYRDDSLYAVMSTPGFSVRDPKDTIPGPSYRPTDYTCVMTSAHIPEGYLDTADVPGTFVIAVSTEGLAELKDRIKMYMCGNANRDGAVNLSDVVHIANYLLGVPGTVEPWLYMSDVNSDCAVNLGDVIHLAKYLFGIPGFELSCECAD